MINKSILLGRLAADPRLHSFDNGGKICRMRVITSRRWRDDKTGEMREHVDGHNISVLVPRIAERVADTFRKGDVVYVEGAMETRKWTDASGQDRFMTEVVIRPFAGGIRRVPTQRTSAGPDMHAPEQKQEQEHGPAQETSPSISVEDTDDWLEGGLGTGNFEDDLFAETFPDSKPEAPDDSFPF